MYGQNNQMKYEYWNNENFSVNIGIIIARK